MTKLTPFLFMEKDERPSFELIEACQNGIELRNAIMHAKRTAGGYKIRRTSSSELMTAFDNIYAVYRFYVTAIERREANSPPTTD